MNPSTTTSYSSFSRHLHWVIAIGFLCTWAAGYYMVSFEDYGIYSIHKQAGLVLMLAMVVRSIYRLLQGWPAPANRYKKWEQIVAKIVHWVLLVVVLLLPFSGVVYSGASGHGVYLLGVDIIPQNVVPNGIDGGEVVKPYSAIWEQRGQTMHWVSSYAFMAIVCLHIVGALKHHLIDKDNTLKRMLYRTK